MRHAKDLPLPVPLIIIMLVYLIAGSIYSVVPPFLEISDEVRHYALVEHLAQGNSLPVQSRVEHQWITEEERQAKRPLTYYAQEGSQPPLYYALMALVALPFDRGDFAQLAQINPHGQLGRADTTSNWNQLIHTDAEGFPWRRTTLAMHLMRFIGVLLGAVTVVCTYYLAKELVGDWRLEIGDSSTNLQSLISSLAAALVAFNPMFLHIMSSVNNDTLATMLSSLALLLGARMIRRAATVPQALLLGVALGCAALSKASGLALLVVVPFFVLFSAFLRTRQRGKGEGKDKARSSMSASSSLVSLSVAMLLPAILIAGWWYVRNQVLYGDFTGATMMARIAGARDVPPTLLELIGEWDGFFKSYWGLFGAVNIPMDLWIYGVLEVLMILGGFGLLLVVGDWLKEIRDWRLEIQRGQQSLIPNFQSRLIAMMCFSAFLVALVALIRWTSLTLASQGRLLFPVISVISIFVALGFVRLWVSIERLMRLPMTRAFVGVTSVALGALALLSPFIYIRPAYQTPQRFQSEAALPPDITRTELFFDDKIRWIGYRVNTPKERVQPGEELDITLYWQGLRPMEQTYSAFLRLLGRNDAEAYILNTYPGGGMWQTTRWQPGEIIADRYRLRIEDTMTNTQLLPTVLRLDAGYWDFGTKQFLNTFDPNGKPTGRQQYEVAGMAAGTNVPSLHAVGQVAEPTTDVSITSILNERFEKAKLRNLSVAQDERSLKLRLDWLVTDDFSDDYTAFVQLFNASGKQMEPQGDRRALNGYFSTRWWRKGDVITNDTYTIDLPSDFPPGQYTIRFGLYKADGTRMPAFDASGRLINDTALSIPVEIE